MATIKKNNNFFFPSSPNIKRYYYASTLMTFGNVVFAIPSDNINYSPIYINKYIENPNFCIESIAGTGTIQVGIYDGKDGLSGARLLWSDNIVVSAAGITKIPSNIKLKEGWYILGSIIISCNSLNARTNATNLFRLLFGERTDIGIGGGIANPQYAQSNPGGLVSTIGSFSSINIVSTANSPSVALEY
jgi:hypothetical protein